MKKNFNYFRFIAMPAVFAVLAIMFLLNLTSCKKDTGEAGADVSAQKIVLRKDTLYMVKGGTFTLRYDIEPETEDEPNVKWTSSDTDVADVNKNGKVTAKNKVGKATITVSTTDGKMKDKCIVIVSAEVSGVIIDPKSSEIFINEELTLTAKVSPSDADQSVEWSSSDTKIATVDANGKVKGVKDGDVTITATSKVNTSKKSTCKVTVKPTTVILNYNEYSLLKGKTVTLTAKVEPNDKDQTVTWTSSDTKIATVDANGKVTAIKDGGPVTITATSKADPSSKATCKITVEPIGVKLDVSEYTTIKDEKIKFTATVTPNGADQSVTWSSSDESVATVAQDGIVTTLTEGTTKITATSKADNTKKASCTIKVEPLVVELNTNCIFLTPTSTYELKATIVSPASCTNKKLEWSSASSSIATVSNYGIVTGVKNGAGTSINVKYKSTTYATCRVEVAFAKRYSESDYYQWDAMDPISGTNPKCNTTTGNATQSCKDCITKDQMRMYLGAGVYYDENGPQYVLNDGMYRRGLWVRKSSKIEGFKENTADKKDKVEPWDGTNLFKKGRPNNIDDYFFLPAGGYYYSGLKSGGYGGYYWLSTVGYSLYFYDDQAVVRSDARYYGHLRLFAE